MESRYFVQEVRKFENHKKGRCPVNCESQGMPNQPGEAGVGLLKHAVSLLPVDLFPGIEPGWGWEDGGDRKNGGLHIQSKCSTPELHPPVPL